MSMHVIKKHAAMFMRVATQAVEFVGSANYPERESAAQEALRRAYEAMLRGRENEIVFRPMDQDGEMMQ